MSDTLKRAMPQWLSRPLFYMGEQVIDQKFFVLKTGTVVRPVAARVYRAYGGHVAYAIRVIPKAGAQ
jgi:hypothetical protein